jgi:hypothetical protein
MAVDAELMFTGGVPYNSVEEVFRALSGAVGDRAIAYPDGEIGELAGWVHNLNHNTWPNVEGVEQLGGGDDIDIDAAQATHRTFKIKEGVTELDLRGTLAYSRVAIESYGVFRRLREEGVIPQGVRFQVALPGAWDAYSSYFPDSQDWPIAELAWQLALQDEYRRMLEVIPAEDLSIQIDFCVEISDASGRIQLDYVPRDVNLLERFTAPGYLAPHVAGIPAEVLLGFHVCAGTYPSYPVAYLPDISLPVAAANAIVRNVGRRVDFIHLPVLKSSGDRYFAPLADLRPGSAKVFLGLECNDGSDAMERRIAAAGRYLKGFGVAHYCGYLWNREIMPRLLQDLATGADKLATPS